MPSDDQHGVKPRKGDFGHKQRYKRDNEWSEEKEEEIEDVTSYHVFGLGWTSDMKYNRQLIKVLNKAINDNQDDLYELVNRTDILLDQIKTFSEAVVDLELRYLGLKSSFEKTFVSVRQAQEAAVLYQTLLPMVLEEEMGRVIYLQAFHTGVQYLLRGQLSMDLVLPEALAQAIKEVNN